MKSISSDVSVFLAGRASRAWNFNRFTGRSLLVKERVESRDELPTGATGTPSGRTPPCSDTLPVPGREPKPGLVPNTCASCCSLAGPVERT